MTSDLLKGKVVLVTGASSGIGEAAARVFAEEGAVVVVTARREERLAALVGELRDTGAEAAYAVGDVRVAEDVARAVDFVVARYGRLDSAFNNAGIGGDRTPLHQMSDDVYDGVMDTNVRGVFNCLRHEIAAMLPNGGGSIVNNSSVAGVVAIPAAAPYIASKHAVVGLTRAAADEYAKQGVRVNAIAPGTTRSEITLDWFGRNPGLQDLVNSLTPQGRTAEPEEIAQAAAWLLSDRCPFLTGTVMPVDGGFVNQ
ncbi:MULTISPECIES: SDR family NAD(P)-dependent oxidoreductase [Streptomyces]|uniref:Glucose 1-dehydrogenase n=1 Tax=Streptomyces caniscabiei TaxID=2746961 RepID=A0ABU4N2X5_9ACTN|nr:MULTISPECIES: glucose 1-dehydrogenase [Streptomyces]MBE4734263.1 glucose 1-dehydrogenase [Streptomyces caniscabiei]MBE4755134.1 glucose 1-dehydrogenase [Streptomyces caniscabiei]MBE4771113.1 glucose 1-dehydrogenase [Streptomyces caniscabiei]MBE4783581.1 glucose 1-dehydrogenase [Streptomyces caniscabiei]MBE4792885.1 glucose 1-dehydrogenase [Streptomyces caniscabiei]